MQLNFMKMEIKNMKENIKIIKEMEKEFFIMKMKIQSMKVNLKMEKKMEKE